MAATDSYFEKRKASKTEHLKRDLAQQELERRQASITSHYFRTRVSLPKSVREGVGG